METKKKYITPEIALVELDNEISLVLQSEPPLGPGEGALLSPEYMINDPFKANMG